MDNKEGNAVCGYGSATTKSEPVLDLKNFATTGRYGGSLALTPGRFSTAAAQYRHSGRLFGRLGDALTAVVGEALSASSPAYISV